MELCELLTQQRPAPATTKGDVLHRQKAASTGLAGAHGPGDPYRLGRRQLGEPGRLGLEHPEGTGPVELDEVAPPAPLDAEGLVDATPAHGLAPRQGEGAVGRGLYRTFDRRPHIHRPPRSLRPGQGMIVNKHPGDAMEAGRYPGSTDTITRIPHP